jgi:hypothetical protein
MLSAAQPASYKPNFAIFCSIAVSLSGSTAGDSFERLACVTPYDLPGSKMTGRKSAGSGSIR